MDIQLDHLESDSGFNQSRFALEFVVVSDVEIFDIQSNLTWQTTTTLDDEHTPGIFKVKNIIVLMLKTCVPLMIKSVDSATMSEPDIVVKKGIFSIFVLKPESQRSVSHIMSGRYLQCFVFCFYSVCFFLSFRLKSWSYLVRTNPCSRTSSGDRSYTQQRFEICRSRPGSLSEIPSIFCCPLSTWRSPSCTRSTARTSTPCWSKRSTSRWARGETATTRKQTIKHGKWNFALQNIMS